MEKKYNFVYKTTHKESGKYYIGVHSTDNMNDGYLGSGTRVKRSIKKYGEDAFEREVIRHFDTNVDAYSYEKKLVTLDTLKDTLCMNIDTGGRGRQSGYKMSEETRRKIGEASKGRFFSKEARDKISKVHKGKGKSKETKVRMSNAQKGEKNHRYGKGHLQKGGKNPMYGKGDLVSGERNGMYGMSGEKNHFFGKSHTEKVKDELRKRFGTKIIFEGEKYDSIRDAHVKTGVSRYIIKKNCKFIK